MTFRRIGAALALSSALLALGGCGSLLSSTPPQLFDLSPKTTFDANAPTVSWQLVVEEPTTPAALNTDRISIRPAPLEIQYLGGVKWSDRAPALVQTLLVESFENSGKIVGVGRRAIGLTGEYTLTSELREFEAFADGAGGATVQVRLVLKLVRQSSGGIIASTTVSRRVEAASDSAADLVVAFDQALGSVLKDTVHWTLERGEADRRAFTE